MERFWNRCWCFFYSFFMFAFLLPLTSFADTPSNMDVSLLKQGIFTPVSTDLSLLYLGQMFGSVGSMLHGTGSQLLGYVFVVFNLGIWVLAGSYIVYTVLSSVLNAAHEGEFMGKKMHTMVPIRVVAGVAALLPKFNGYSFIQLIVMWAVVQGVGLADSVWNSAIDFFHKGGAIYQRTPATQTQPYDAEQVFNTLKGMTDILNAQICMYSLQDPAKPPANYYWITPNGSDLKNNPGSVSFSNEKDKALCGSIKYVKTDSDVDLDVTAAVEAARVDLDPVAYAIVNQQRVKKTPYAPSCLGANDTSVKQGNYCPESNALLMALSDYLSVMTMIRQQKNTQSAGKPDPFADAKAEGWILAGKYYQKMAYANINSDAIKKKILMDSDYSVPIGVSPPYQLTSIQAQPISEALKSALNNMGPNYLSQLKEAISATQGNVDDANQSSADKAGFYRQASLILPLLYPPSMGLEACTGGLHVTTTNEQAKADWAKVDAAYLFHDRAGGPTVYEPGSICDIQQKISDLGNRYLTQRLESKSGNNIIDADVFTLMQSPINAWFSTVLNPGVDYQDPVARMRMLGLKMIAAANKFWSDATGHVFMVLGVSAAVTTTALIAMAIPYGFLDSTPLSGSRGANLMSATSTAMQMAFQIIMARIFWYLPLGIALSTPIFVLGATLAVYIPLIPFMLFMFAALGWFIAVLEAMVAAPLVALGLTHPEGHDLLGKAEQSIMLLLGVFLRPVLLITGLLAGIILTFIAAKLLDAGFFDLMYAQLTNHDDVSGGTQFVVIIGMLVIYTMAMIAIVDQSFSLIYVLSDKILRWIGGHPEQSAEGGMLQQVKSGYEGKIGEGSQGGGQQVSSIKSSGITAQAPPPMQKSKKKGPQMDSPGGGNAAGAEATPDGGGGGGGTDDDKKQDFKHTDSSSKNDT